MVSSYVTKNCLQTTMAFSLMSYSNKQCHNVCITILLYVPFPDGGPILSCSLSHDIRWFYPGHHQHYHAEQHHHSNADTEQQIQLLSI